MCCGEISLGRGSGTCWNSLRDFGLVKYEWIDTGKNTCHHESSIRLAINIVHARPHRQGTKSWSRRQTDCFVPRCCTSATEPHVPSCMMTWGTIKFVQGCPNNILIYTNSTWKLWPSPWNVMKKIQIFWSGLLLGRRQRSITMNKKARDISCSRDTCLLQ